MNIQTNHKKYIFDPNNNKVFDTVNKIYYDPYTNVVINGSDCIFKLYNKKNRSITVHKVNLSKYRSIDINRINYFNIAKRIKNASKEQLKSISDYLNNTLHL